MLKIFEFHLENISNSETLCNSMIFMREDKMTSSNYEIWVGSFKGSISSPFGINFQFGFFEFYSNYFSPKIKYMENRVTWFPTSEKLERNKFELILVFLKWFLLDFIKAVALFDLFEYFGLYLTLQKCWCCRKSFSENFDI